MACCPLPNPPSPSLEQYADMGIEGVFGCPTCTANGADIGDTPGVAPLVQHLVATELQDPTSSLFPAFVAHVGDIRFVWLRLGA
jgi:hypothetical protein